MIHYAAIRTQLETDIRAVIGAGAPVIFGRPRREVTELPHAVVKSECSRDWEGVQMSESYVFSVRLAFPFAGNVTDAGTEDYLAGKALELINQATPRVRPLEYALVGEAPIVSDVRFDDSRDEDAEIAVVLTLEMTTYVPLPA